MSDAVLSDLIKQIQERDQAAFGRLYDLIAPRMQALCMRILSVRAEAEEIVAETFWQVWNQADRYDPERGSVLAWITIMARSRALDRLRQRQRQANSVVLDPAPEHETVVPESELLQDEERRAVVDAVSALSDEQRRSIELAYYDGLSHTEIARRLDQPLGTIKSRIRLGLMRLRTALDAHLGGTP